MLSMKYKKIYDEIIKNRLDNPVLNDYTECHHIIPKSLGGSDDEANLVNLLAREHFICHLLLTKMYEEGSNEWVKMVKAFMRMYSFNPYQNRYSNNKWYEYLRKNFSKAQSINQGGKNNSNYGTVWISNVSERKCIKIKKELLNEYLNNGWIKFRIIKWDSYDIQDNKITMNCDINKQGKLKPHYICPSRRKVFEKTKEKIEDKKKLFNYYWEIYQRHTFPKFVEITGYDRTLENLIDNFHRYVDNYVPRQRKKYKKI